MLNCPKILVEKQTYKFNESISSDIILKVTIKIFTTSAGFKKAKLMK
jgi:hypothetical protein